MARFIEVLRNGCVSVDICVPNVFCHSIPEFRFSFSHILPCTFCASDEIDQIFGCTVITKFRRVCVTGVHAFKVFRLVHLGAVLAIILRLCFRLSRLLVFPWGGSNANLCMPMSGYYSTILNGEKEYFKEGFKSAF